MNAVQQEALRLLGAALKNEPFEMNPATDWKAVYKEMCVQGVVALPRKIVREMSLDADLKKAWTQAATVNIGYCMKLMHEELEIKKFFNAEQIPFTVLKGTASAMYYPQPLLRSRSDIDLITCREDHDQALECLEKNGYTIRKDDTRHVCFSKNGISIELHRFFTPFLESEKDYSLQELIEEGIHHSGLSEKGENGVPVLPDSVNGLILLSHIALHKEGGIGLRQWLDFVVFAQAVLTDDFWNKSFQQETEKYGYTRLAKVLARTGQIYLGLCKDIHWCQDVDNEVCEELMEFMLSLGDLGAKQGTQDFQYTMVLNKTSGGLKNRFQYLQRTGAANWKAAEKHPWLKPFAWLYKLEQYAVKALHSGHPISKLLNGMRKTRKHQDLFTKLGIANNSAKDLQSYVQSGSN